ncbi:MAG: hypothetical protein J3T61_07880 [Candidatus Brocadiales bacterium]|nr:hypothetical protein [Candidatus Bathyanammoxibius sp.]
MNEVQQIPENVGAGFWWITPLATGIAAFVGAIGAFFIARWQLGKQHESAINAQRELVREQLQLNIYRDIADKMEMCSNALNQFMISTISFPISLRTRMRIYSAFKRDSGPEDYTTERFSEVRARASDGVFGVMWILEKYEIVLPDFQVFREKLSKRNQDLSVECDKFHEKARPFLLPEPPRNSSGVPQFPTDDEFSELEEITSTLRGITLDLQMYLKDLITEAQNHLLANLFETRISPRTPSDSRFEAIRVDAGHKMDT